MIEYRIGDCLDAPERPVVFAHVVNDVGLFGKGFSGALATRYPYAAESYRTWHAGGFGDGFPFGLGRVLVPLVGEERVPGLRAPPAVAHLCAMRGVRGRGNAVPLVPAALRAALNGLAFHIRWRVVHGGDGVAAIVMPRIGCGLAGGSWDAVEPLVREELSEFRVIVYDLPSANWSSQ